MINIKALSPLEMDAAEKHFKILSRERQKMQKRRSKVKRNYKTYTESRGRKRSDKKTLALDTSNTYQRLILKQKDLLTIYDVCYILQPSLKCSYQKMRKDLVDTVYVLNYMFTKGWIEFKHVNRGKRGTNTHVLIKREYLKEFSYFYRSILR